MPSTARNASMHENIRTKHFLGLQKTPEKRPEMFSSPKTSRNFLERQTRALSVFKVLTPANKLLSLYRSNWNLEVLVFEERGKPEYPKKNLSEQGREPTTNSTHIIMTPSPGIEPDVTKTGNGERGTGNGERGTGVWERVYSGFPHNFQKPRAPGHEFGEKKQLFLTITPVVIKFLSNLIYVSIFNECKKRSEEKGSEKHVLMLEFARLSHLFELLWESRKKLIFVHFSMQLSSQLCHIFKCTWTYFFSFQCRKMVSYAIETTFNLKPWDWMLWLRLKHCCYRA